MNARRDRPAQTTLYILSGHKGLRFFKSNIPASPVIMRRIVDGSGVGVGAAAFAAAEENVTPVDEPRPIVAVSIKEVSLLST